MRIEVGDKVEIKQWEDMEQEYGLEDGYIKVRYGFIPSMREFCGQKFEVKSNRYNHIRLIDSSGEELPHAFCSEMLILRNDFKAGDKIIIREWDDMEREFGLDYGHINTAPVFNNRMKHLCGRTATIDSINGKKLYLSEWSSIEGDMDWEITTDMVELVSSKVQKGNKHLENHKVVIKEWDTMEQEYGLNEFGFINCDFTPSMKHLCGRIAKISAFDGDRLYLTDWEDNSGKIDWVFTLDMVTLVDKTETSSI